MLRYWPVFVRLLSHTPRTAPVLPLLGGVLIATGVAGAPTFAGAELTPADHVTLLRVAAVAAALGFAFVLDDPAAAVTAVVPTPRLVRHAARTVPALVVGAGWWALAVWLTRAGADTAVWTVLPVWSVALETATLVAVALAAAAVRARTTAAAGVAAAPVLLVVAAALALLPERLHVFPPPGDPDWRPSHLGWAAALLLLLAVFVLAGRERAGGRATAPPGSPGGAA